MSAAMLEALTQSMARAGATPSAAAAGLDALEPYPLYHHRRQYAKLQLGQAAGAVTAKPYGVVASYREFWLQELAQDLKQARRHDKTPLVPLPLPYACGE